MVSWPGAVGTSVAGVTRPDSSAAAIVKGLSVAPGSLLRRPLRGALDLAAAREPEVAPVLRRADRFDVLDHAPEPVLDHAPAAGLAAERRLERESDAPPPGVVDPGG